MASSPWASQTGRGGLPSRLDDDHVKGLHLAGAEVFGEHVETQRGSLSSGRSASRSKSRVARCRTASGTKTTTGTRTATNGRFTTFPAQATQVPVSFMR